MEDKILKVIRETLPEKEVGVVKKALEEREDFKSRLEESEKRLEKVITERDEVTKERDDLKKRETENKELNAELKGKEKEIAGREKEMDQKLAEKEVSVIRECFDKVMRVPTIRKNIQKSIPMERNGNGYVENHSESTNEEIIEE